MLQWIIDQKNNGGIDVDIISTSTDWYGPSSEIMNATLNASIAISSSIGNKYGITTTVASPASWHLDEIDGNIAVGAHEDSDGDYEQLYIANRVVRDNPSTSMVMAVGTHVVSTIPVEWGGAVSDEYWEKTGTSMAQPVVAGAAALYIQKYKMEHDGVVPTPAQIEAWLVDEATTEPDPDYAGASEGLYGAGILTLDEFKFFDSDGDGLSDSDETYIYGTDPNNLDTDGDGLVDGDEITYGANPHDTDSDNDCLIDGVEVHTYGTSPILADTDNDGVYDNREIYMYGTDPLLWDTDNDGMPDGWEIDHCDVLLWPTRADAFEDPDGDNLCNGDEYAYNTNPLDPDTDGDGLTDGYEVSHQSDPLSWSPAAQVDALSLAWQYSSNIKGRAVWVQHTTATLTISMQLYRCSSSTSHSGGVAVGNNITTDSSSTGTRSYEATLANYNTLTGGKHYWLRIRITDSAGNVVDDYWEYSFYKGGGGGHNWF